MSAEQALNLLRNLVRGSVLDRFPEEAVRETAARVRTIVVPEMNTGQLAKVLRAEFLVDVEPYTRVQGRPLFAPEIEAAILERRLAGLLETRAARSTGKARS